MHPLDRLDDAPRLVRIGVALLAVGATLLATPVAYTAWTPTPGFVATYSFDVVAVAGEEREHLERGLEATPYRALSARERRLFEAGRTEEGARVCGPIPDTLRLVRRNGTAYTARARQHGDSTAPPGCDAPLHNRVFEAVHGLRPPGYALTLLGGWLVAIGAVWSRTERS